MYDDGTHGDVVASDTIYTTQLLVNEAAPKTRHFKVTAAYSAIRNRYLSAPVSVTVYPPLPPFLVEEALAAIQALQSHFDDNIAAGMDVGAARQVALQEALANPSIGPGNANLSGPNLSLFYVYVDPATGYTFRIPGILILVDPANPTDAAGNSVPTNLPADAKGPGNDKLLIWGPGYQTADPQNAIVEHAQTQFNNTEYMTFSPDPPVITGGASATLETVKQWGNYGTVIIHTHGGLWDLNGNKQVVLVTGTPVTFWNQYLWYAFDLMANRIGIAGDGRFVFYPSFITKDVSGMKNTFLYLGACESLQNDTLWNALKAKGAKVAFGWSQTVNRGFNGTTFAALIDPMLPHTNPPDPKSAKEAFDAVPNKTDPFGGFNATLTMRTASAEWEKFYFAEGGLVNGDFETGDWTGWTHGGALSDGRNYQVIVGARKHAGSWSAALGRWDTAYTGANSALEPYGYEWFYQDFTVPSNATKLSFWWWMETYDTAIWDWFDAYLQTTGGATLKSPGGQGREARIELRPLLEHRDVADTSRPTSRRTGGSVSGSTSIRGWTATATSSARTWMTSRSSELTTRGQGRQTGEPDLAPLATGRPARRGSQAPPRRRALCACMASLVLAAGVPARVAWSASVSRENTAVRPEVKRFLDELDGWRIVSPQHTTDSLAPTPREGGVASPRPFPAGRYEIAFERGGERRTLLVQTEEKVPHFAAVIPGVTDIGGYVEILARPGAGTLAGVRLGDAELDYLLTKL